MNKATLYFLVALTLSSCLPQDTQVPQSPLLPLLERKSGLIAYVGLDGNMYLSDQGGGNLTQVTNDADVNNADQNTYWYYEIPAWAKNRNEVAFIGLGVENGILESSISVYNVDDEKITSVYESNSEIPVYLNWQPGDEKISFISTTQLRDNLILEIVPSIGGDTTILDAGSPYYWSWAPDGSVLVTHTGNELATSPDHLSFIRLDDDVMEFGMDFVPAPFQAPAWSPDGSRIALARSSDPGNEIIVTDSNGNHLSTVGTFRDKTALAWSFDSNKLAYLDDASFSLNGTVGVLHAYNLETNTEIVVDDPAVATFFWSPNSREIAYFTLLPISGNNDPNTANTTPQYGLRLSVLDVENGETRKLAEYLPTEQFKSMLPFFDQYHQSATIWSPDNNNIVISFIDPDGQPSIAIVPASGTLEPRILAPGFLAFWSWK